MEAVTEEDVEVYTEEAVRVYKACARVPLASRAHIAVIDNGKVEVEVTWSQREVERGKKISYNKSYFVEQGSEGVEGVSKLCGSSFQTDTSNM